LVEACKILCGIIPVFLSQRWYFVRKNLLLTKD